MVAAPAVAFPAVLCAFASVPQRGKPGSLSCMFGRTGKDGDVWQTAELGEKGLVMLLYTAAKRSMLPRQSCLSEGSAPLSVIPGM